MRGWIGLAVSAALLAEAGAAAAQKRDDFCHDLGRVIDAAGEADPFARLERSALAPPNLGFQYGCGRSGSARQRFWLCTQNLAPDRLSLSALAEATRACFPEAEILPA